MGTLHSPFKRTHFWGAQSNPTHFTLEKAELVPSFPFSPPPQTGEGLKNCFHGGAQEGEF